MSKGGVIVRGHVFSSQKEVSRVVGGEFNVFDVEGLGLRGCSCKEILTLRIKFPYLQSKLIKRVDIFKSFH